MTSFQMVETTGTIDENGILQVGPFAGIPAGQVRVSVAVPHEYDASEISPSQWSAGLSRLMAPHFVDDPSEDIYTREDGKPYDATQD